MDRMTLITLNLTFQELGLLTHSGIKSAISQRVRRS